MDSGTSTIAPDLMQDLPVPGAPVTLELPPRPVRVRRPVQPPRSRSRAGRIRRWAVAVGFVAVVTITTVGLILLALTQEQPSWWRAVNPKDPGTIQAAEKLENGVATLLTQARPPGAGPNDDPNRPWTVSLSAADANAWLNARLSKWLDSQDDITFKWPAAVAEVQVAFDDGLIFVGAKVRTAASRQGAAREQVLSAAIAPRFAADGSLWMPAEHVGIGRLGIPASWVLGRTGGGPMKAAAAGATVPNDLADLPQTKEVMAAFAGKNAVMTNPIIKLGDGRRVRLLALQARGGKLLITCRTENRETVRADARGHDTKPD